MEAGVIDSASVGHISSKREIFTSIRVVMHLLVINKQEQAQQQQLFVCQQLADLGMDFLSLFAITHHDVCLPHHGCLDKTLVPLLDSNLCAMSFCPSLASGQCNLSLFVRTYQCCPVTAATESMLCEERLQWSACNNLGPL